MEHVAQFVQEVLKPVVPAGTQRFYRGVPKHFRVTLPSLRRSDVALSCRVDHVFLRVCMLLFLFGPPSKKLYLEVHDFGQAE